MKPLCAQWLKEMYDSILAHPDINRNGITAAGITEGFKFIFMTAISTVLY